MEEHTKKVQQALMLKLPSLSSTVAFLSELRTVWQQHCRAVNMLNNVLLMLDRTYVLQHLDVSPLWELGIVLFRKDLLAVGEIRGRVVDGINEMMRQDRERITVDNSLVETLVKMLRDVKLYADAFEQSFLNSTTMYYMKEAALATTKPVADFLEHVEKRLIDEFSRCTSCGLESSTRRKTIEIMETQLIERNVTTILTRGFSNIMDANRISDLKRMYSLLRRVKALPAMKDAFIAYVKTKGSERMLDNSRDRDMHLIEDLLSMRRNLEKVVTEAFVSDKEFSSALKVCLRLCDLIY